MKRLHTGCCSHATSTNSSLQRNEKELNLALAPSNFKRDSCPPLVRLRGAGRTRRQIPYRDSAARCMTILLCLHFCCGTRLIQRMNIEQFHALQGNAARHKICTDNSEVISVSHSLNIRMSSREFAEKVSSKSGTISGTPC